MADELAVLIRACEEEDRLAVSDSVAQARDGMQESLSLYDFFDSDSFWVFVAESGDAFVGYATAARIPKLDSRVGFMHLDELAVLRLHRRMGVAKAIVDAVDSLARKLNLAGIRVAVRPTNEAAKTF